MTVLWLFWRTYGAVRSFFYSTPHKTMGVQSQFRKKASSAIRNRSRHQLRANNTNTAHIDLQGRCIQCLKVAQAKATGGPAPHRAHNNNCPNSRANRAQQQGEVTLPVPSKGLARGHWIKSQDQINKFLAPRRSSGIAASITSPAPYHNIMACENTVVLKDDSPAGAGIGPSNRIVASNATRTRNPRNPISNRIVASEATGISNPSNPIPSRASNRRITSDNEKTTGTHNMIDDATPTSSTRTSDDATCTSNDATPTTTRTSKSANLASIIRRELDTRMFDSKTASANSSTNKAPKAISEATHCILGKLPSKFNKNSNVALDSERVQEAMQWYQDAFQDKAGLKFGPEAMNVRPSPYYHSIVGSTIYFVRWELICPGITLHCTDAQCTGELIHDRWDFSKHRQLTPIYCMTGPTMHACSMLYECNCCGKRLAGNSGELLHSLPIPLQELYPVNARYAEGNFHLSRDFSDWLEMLSVTYCNGEVFSKSLVEKLGREYQLRAASYYDLCHMNGMTNALPYPEFEEWLGSTPPEGCKLRDLLGNSARSSRTLCGISDYERAKLEIQSVLSSSSFAHDHTFEAVKNYPAKLGAKAAFNASIETGEIATCVLVKSTAASQYAHAAECLARREGFKPKVMYSDIWPKGASFWKLLFGDGMKGRLGLFHFVQRIIRTLRDNHSDYQLAIRELLVCIYRYHDSDEADLIQCLKAGLMGHGKVRHSDADIIAMKVTKEWKKKYETFLRKIIYPGPKIVTALLGWFVRFKVDHSDGEEPGGGRICPISGKKLFTPDTKPTIGECCKVAEHLSDLLPLDEIYTKVDAPPRAKHGLPIYLSNRGESRLENINGQQAQMANTNMRESLSDILTLGGCARYNVRVREKLWFNKLPPAKKANFPAWRRGVPAFYNHSNKRIINEKAARVGAGHLFHHVRPLPRDNDEVFLSEYFHQQELRNSSIAPHRENDRCQCPSCGGNQVLLPFERQNGATMGRSESASSSKKRPPPVDGMVWDAYNNKYRAVLIGKKIVVAPARITQKDDDTFFSPLPSQTVLPPVSASKIRGVRDGMAAQKAAAPNFTASYFPTVGGFYYPLMVPPFYPPPPSPQFMMPTIPQQKAFLRRKKLQQEYCCITFTSWCLKQNRNGRPPHHALCSKRKKNVKLI
jgi:hypothetical protein